MSATTYQTFDADTGTPVPEAKPGPMTTTVDMAPCQFGDTFRHPCFWILVGVVGVIGVQYLLKGKRE